MNSKHISKYINNGYICKVGDIIEVSIKDLPINSHALVEVKCDICGNKKHLRYQVYNKSFLNQLIYSCSTKCGVLKYENTCLAKYGVSNYAKTNECRIKTENTCLSRYGELVPARNKQVMNKIQKTKVNLGLQNEDVNLDRFHLYKKSVRSLTNRNKKKLFENWDGFDYYDNSKIIQNFNLNSNDKDYPTIDHRISIFYGFINNIDPIIISDISNLCITKRYINSSKQTKNTWNI